MHISIIKGIRLGFTNLQTHKDQREIKECLHIQKTKQITIVNLFNKLAAVAADASMGLQICGPMPESFYNENVHYKMEGVMDGLAHTVFNNNGIQYRIWVPIFPLQQWGQILQYIMYTFWCFEAVEGSGTIDVYEPQF